MKLRFLLPVTLLLAFPAFASTVALPAVQINFSISVLSALPPGPCIPPGPCRVHGTLDFFESSSLSNTILLDSFTVPSLNPGDTFTISLVPPGPCFQTGACSITATFDGTFDTPTGTFDATIFNSGDKLPDSEPSTLPAVQIPFGGASGPLVTFDAPVTIGSWTASVTPAPEPASLLLVAVGFGALIRRRAFAR